MKNILNIRASFFALSQAIFWTIFTCPLFAQNKIFPGADEHTVSQAHYFTWINNTAGGAPEDQTKINLDFFKWLNDEYGMQLDIYAFDAAIMDMAILRKKKKSAQICWSLFAGTSISDYSKWI